MYSDLEIFPPGSKLILAGDIEAWILQVCIRDRNSVQYQVSWWDGRRRICEWVEAHEVKRSDPDARPLLIGFGS